MRGTQPPSIPTGLPLYCSVRTGRLIGISLMEVAYKSLAQIEVPTCER